VSTNTLPPQDRATCGIAVRNYGEAGAIDYFGRQYGLPPVITGHQNYWLWDRTITPAMHGHLCRTRQELESQLLASRSPARLPSLRIPSRIIAKWICRGPSTAPATSWYGAKNWSNTGSNISCCSLPGGTAIFVCEH